MSVSSSLNTGSSSSSSSPPFPSTKLVSRAGTEELAIKVLASLKPILSDRSKMLNMEFTEASVARVHQSLEQISDEGDKLFGSMSQAELLQSPDVLEFISKRFLSVLGPVMSEASQMPPNIYAVAGVSEAVFTHAFDRKPIAVTESLATCVGVAGYDKANRFGFVVHFSSLAGLETSKAMLIEKIKLLAKREIKDPVEIHLRGGIENVSESLLAGIETWIKSGAEIGCPMNIASKEVLTKGLVDESGAPNAMSISVDTRDGTIGTYDSSKNPYAKKKVEIASKEEFGKIFGEVFSECVMKAPKIEIAYMPSI